MASRGAHRIAFEMQWSAQSSDETARRQEQYRSSGVRGLWLFRHPSAVQVSKDIPSLHVEVQLDPALAWVSIPHETPYGSKKMEYQWGPKIELGRFVRGCLARKFIWAPGIEEVVPLEVFTADQVCWRCKRPTSIVTRLVFRVDLLVPGARSVSLKMGNFDNPVGRTVLAQALGSADLRALGIGQVKERFSRTRGHAYLSNGCVHCDALQGAFFENELYGEDAATLTVECTMDSELFDGARFDTPFRWVFDERFEPGTDLP
jgi:competence protein CoiA